tara:strand:- start:322 stop:576 length:255 start_codon:yes stop_codon:yes gene_type:complete
MNYSTNYILSDLQEIFRDCFDDDNLVLKPSTSAIDIEDWDSLMQITLLITIEKHFKLRFDPNEIQKLNNIGEMVLLIDRHLNEK